MLMRITSLRLIIANNNLGEKLLLFIEKLFQPFYFEEMDYSEEVSYK